MKELRIVIRAVVILSTALLCSWRIELIACAPYDAPVPPSLLVVNKSEATLAFVDPETFHVVARAPTGEHPHEVTVSSDGKTAFVTNYGDDERPGHTISVIDIAGRRETKRINLGALIRPHGIAESGGSVYFSVEGSHAIGRYNPVSDRLDLIVGTGQMKTHMLVVTPDARKIYTANAGSNTVTVIEQDADFGVIRIAQIAVGQGPEGIDLSPDGKEVWVAHLGDGALSIIDVMTDRVKRKLVAGTTPIRLKFTPDGRQVLVTDLRSGDVIIFDSATRKRIASLQVGSAPTNILITPDSRRAFISLAGSNQLAVIDLEALVMTKTFKSGAGPDGLAWAGRVTDRRSY